MKYKYLLDNCLKIFVGDPADLAGTGWEIVGSTTSVGTLKGSDFDGRYLRGSDGTVEPLTKNGYTTALNNWRTSNHSHTHSYTGADSTSNAVYLSGANIVDAATNTNSTTNYDANKGHTHTVVSWNNDNTCRNEQGSKGIKLDVYRHNAYASLTWGVGDTIFVRTLKSDIQDTVSRENTNNSTSVTFPFNGTNSNHNHSTTDVNFTTNMNFTNMSSSNHKHNIANSITWDSTTKPAHTTVWLIKYVG